MPAVEVSPAKDAPLVEEEGGATNSEQQQVTNTLGAEQETRNFNKIFRLHCAAAIFFIIQTIGYIIGLPDTSIRLTTAFPVMVGGPIGNPSQQIHEEFNPCWLIVTFVLLAAVDHSIITILAYTRPKLMREYLFVKQTNPLRWLEYFFSASLMLIAISMLAGVHDVHLWFCFGILNSIGLVTGQFLELLPRADAKANPPIKASCLAKYIYWLGTYAMAAPWFPIFCYFFQPTVSPPSFVYAAFLGTLLLFTTFACNSYLHHICGKYPFYKAEVIYVVLSFTAKTFLAADVFGGLAAASKD